MKCSCFSIKLFFLLIILICVTRVFSQTTTLIIYNDEGRKFYVLFGGTKQNIEPETNVKIVDINLSAIKFKIKFENPDWPDMAKLIHLLPGTETFIRIEKNKRGQLVFIQVNEASLDHEVFAQGQKTVSYIEPSGTKYNGPVGCPFPVSNSDFKRLKSIIESDSIEKYSNTKQYFATNCFYSHQVKEIIMIFVDDEVKVELAKYAYSYTYDIGNYFIVNNTFEYESTKEELFEFLNSL